MEGFARSLATAVLALLADVLPQDHRRKRRSSY